MDPFRGKVVIITGAASGIGLALSEALAARGACITMTDLQQKPVEERARSLERDGVAVRGRPLDVTDAPAFARLVGEVVEAEGRLDILFNNAGIGVGAEAYDFTHDDWASVIKVNLLGVAQGVMAAYPLMVRQQQGHIVNVASVAGLFPLPGEISYTASKFGVVGLSHALRAEGADLGVRVSVVCPGRVNTPIYDTSKLVGFDKEKVMALWPRGITAKRAVSIILRGVARNRATIVVTQHARVFAWMYRASPSLSLRIARLYMRRVREAKVPGTGLG